MEINDEDFSYYEPFDASSLTQYRASLLSLQSPSLQYLPKAKNQRNFVKKPCSSTNKINNDEVDRLKCLIFNENKEIQYQRILESKTQEINKLRQQIKQQRMTKDASQYENSNINSQINPSNEKYEEAILFLRQSLQYSLEKCKNAHKVVNNYLLNEKLLKIMSVRNHQLFELTSLLDSFKRQGMRDVDILELKELKDSLNRTLMSSEYASSKDIEVDFFSKTVKIFMVVS